VFIYANDKVTDAKKSNELEIAYYIFIATDNCG